MRGSLATREFSQSKMAETYRGREKDDIHSIYNKTLPNRKKFFSSVKKRSSKKKSGSKSSRMDIEVRPFFIKN